MISLMKLSLFPKIIRVVTVPRNKKHHVIFYSENSNFTDVYNLLKIKKTFVKKISFPPYKIPRLIFEQSDLAKYKALKLMPIKAIDTIKENAFIDTSKFMDLLDSKYGRKSYHRSIVLTKIIDYLNECRFEDSENILLYHIDLSKDLAKMPQFRRSWPLVAMAKAGDGRFPFDCVIVCLTLNGNVRYFSIYNKNMKKLTSSKIFNIFKSLKKGKVKDEEIEKEVEKEVEVEKDKIEKEEDYDLLESTYEPTKKLIERYKENIQLRESTSFQLKSLEVLQKPRKV